VPSLALPLSRETATLSDDRNACSVSTVGRETCHLRPAGYGGSSGRLGRMVADCAEDVRRLSEVMRFERCVVGNVRDFLCGLGRSASTLENAWRPAGRTSRPRERLGVAAAS
jgi:hypothetical protein